MDFSKPPSNPDDLKQVHKLLNSDPKRYLELHNQWIAHHPSDPHLYFSRHFAWMALGEPRKALDDLDRSIALEPRRTTIWSRGDVYRHVGEYERARDEYARAEAMDPDGWARDAFPLLYQADVHARLGDEPKALACCARLPDHFWTPGMNELPAGGKAEIAEELRRRAAAARGVANDI